jgi:hypothetical protein
MKHISDDKAVLFPFPSGFRTHSFACVKLLVESSKISDWHDKAKFIYGKMDNDNESAMDITIKHRSIRIAEYLIQAHPTPDAW